MYLKRQPDVIADGIVVSSYPVLRYTMLANCLADGSIVFRSRPSLEPIIPNHDVDRVLSLSQTGFHFPATDPCKFHNNIALHMLILIIRSLNLRPFSKLLRCCSS